MNKKLHAKHLGVIQTFWDPGYLLSFLSKQNQPGKTLGFALLKFPALLHNTYSAGAIFGKRQFVALFFEPFFGACPSCGAVHVVYSAFSTGSKGRLLVGRKNYPGSRKRALLKRFSECPWRTKPLSNSQRIIFTLCNCSLWIFNALLLFITEGFRLAARLVCSGLGGGCCFVIFLNWCKWE